MKTFFDAVKMLGYFAYVTGGQIFGIIFASVTEYRCPWCGTWWPTWKTPEWGPRTAENKRWCSHCGRRV